jgi:hypothetical protein
MAQLFSGSAVNALTDAAENQRRQLEAANAIEGHIQNIDRAKTNLPRGTMVPNNGAAQVGLAPPKPLAPDPTDFGVYNGAGAGLTPPTGQAAFPAAASAQAPAGASLTQPTAGGTTQVTRAVWDSMRPETQQAIVDTYNAQHPNYKLQPTNKTVVRVAQPLTKEQYAAMLPAQTTADMVQAYAQRDPNYKPVTQSAPGKGNLPSGGVPKRAQELIEAAPTATQTPQAQKVAQFAQAIGIDPAKALATFGMESGFGHVKTNDWQTAIEDGTGWGLMQVTPATARGTARYFSDPKNLEQFPNDQQNIKALVQMVLQGNPNNEETQIAAGILQLKYIDAIGIKDPSLVGAAYQGVPEKVLAAGAPTGATDGNLSNVDYANNWNALYTHFSGSAPAQTAAAPDQTQANAIPAPAGITPPKAGTPAAAGATSAGLAQSKIPSFDTRIRFATTQQPQAFDYHRDQIMQSRQLYVSQIETAQKQFAAENTKYTNEFNAAQQAYLTAQRANDIAGMQIAQDQLDKLQTYGNDLSARINNFQTTAQDTVHKYNDLLLQNESDAAIRDLHSGDPRRAGALLTQMGGQSVRFQRTTDGDFVRIDGDHYAIDDRTGQAKRFTMADIAYEVYRLADQNRAAAMDASSVAGRVHGDEMELQHLKNDGDLLSTVAKATINSRGDMERELARLASDNKVTKNDDGSLSIVYNNRIVTYDRNAIQATIGGDEIPTTGITVIAIPQAGLVTN